jgi:hypothetical protein
VEEVTGQPAAPEPSVEEMASSVAKGILQSEEGPAAVTPRDDKGKFTKAQPEAQAEEVADEQPEAEAQPPEEEAQQQPEEVDWDSLKGIKRKLKVKAEDGSDEEVELTLEEMEKGVMLERAFRMKTAQLARERESLQSKVKEAIEPKLKEYDDKLQLAEQAIWHTLAPEIQSIDWNKLAEENPAEWAKKYQHVQNVNARLAQIQAERKRISEQRSEEQQKEMKKQAQEAIERLQERIPGWNNDIYGKVLKAGKDVYGFKAEEVNAITDHRAIEVLHDAMKYRELKAKPPAEKKVVTTPKVVKPGAAQEKPDPKAQKWSEGMARLKKSGRTEDAVELAKLMLTRESR